MGRRLAVGFVLLLASTSSRVLWAEPISYSESASGDLGELPSPRVFSLAFGTNIFSGQLGAGSGFGDFDSFAFSVPAGGFLNAISYTILTTLVPRTIEGGSSFYLVPGNAPPYPALGLISVVARFPGELAQKSVFLPALPLSAGTYGISHSGMSFGTGSWTGEGGFTQRYTWSLRVDDAAAAPVPEPASAALVLVGLAALHVRRRAAGR
jgi:hypothetical protein